MAFGYEPLNKWGSSERRLKSEVVDLGLSAVSVKSALSSPSDPENFYTNWAGVTESIPPTPLFSHFSQLSK